MKFTLLKLLSIFIFAFGIFLLVPKNTRAAAYTCKTTQSCSFCYSSCTQSCTTTKCCYDFNGDPLGCTKTYSTPSCTGGACPTPTPVPAGTPDGQCLAPGAAFCTSGNSYFDASCAVTETRCGSLAPPPPSGGGGSCINECNGTSCSDGRGAVIDSSSKCGPDVGCGGSERLTNFSCWNSCNTAKDLCTSKCVYSSSCTNSTCGNVQGVPKIYTCGACAPFSTNGQQSCCSPCRKYLGYRVCYYPTGGDYNAAECSLADASCGSSCSAGGGTNCTTTAPTNLSVTKTGSNTWLLTWTIGSNGAKQFVYVGTDRGQVEGNCPYGTTPGSACVVADENVAPATQSYNISNLSAGVIYYYRVVTYSGGCSSASTTLTRPSSCNADQPNLALSVGSTATLTTLISGSAEIASVDYVKSGPSIKVNPASDKTYVYSTSVTGLSLGSGTVTSNVINATGATICTSVSNVAVVNGNPWWQVKDGDIITNGDLNSSVPPGNYFNTAGAGGFPGIPAYGGATNLTGANVSAVGWLAASGYDAARIFNSAYYLNAIPKDTVINSLPSSIDGSAIASGGTATNGVYWYIYDPAQNGGLDLTINTPANLGARKVILIVKGAGVTLKGNINLTKGSGFFLLAAGSITVDPIVGGGGVPNLEGVYVADGVFRTGIASTQLWIRGTVAAYGGVSLSRDLGNANSTSPAEIIEYAPDLELLFPSAIANHPTSWQEVAP